MVRWMCGVELQDRVPSKGLREKLEAINIACKESIGHARRVNRDWFGENDPTLTRLIDEKWAALNAFRADPKSKRKKIAYRKAKAEVQSHDEQRTYGCKIALGKYKSMRIPTTWRLSSLQSRKYTVPLKVAPYHFSARTPALC